VIADIRGQPMQLIAPFTVHPSASKKKSGGGIGTLSLPAVE
jgi:hypothetical protein